MYKCFDLSTNILLEIEAESILQTDEPRTMTVLSPLSNHENITEHCLKQGLPLGLSTFSDAPSNNNEMKIDSAYNF